MRLQARYKPLMSLAIIQRMGFFRFLSFAVVVAIMGLVLPGCGRTGDRTLNVYAASSLTDAFAEIAAAYEQAHPDRVVRLNFGGSSALAAQILEGAPAHVFASANPAQMARVAEAGLLANDVMRFATNRLTVIVPAANPAQIESLSDLANPGIRLVLAASGVPVREYTGIVLERMTADSAFDTGYAASVLANLVSEEDNVRQVVLKVALGEADAGLVYTSDVTPDMGQQVRTLAIPDEYNVTASYPIAALHDSARSFIDFVLSRAGQDILISHGFGPAE